MPLMSITEYAAHRGVSRRAVYDAIEQGRIQRSGAQIDSDAADAAWSANTREVQENSKRGKSLDGDAAATEEGETLAAASRRKEIALADIREMERDDAAKLLVHVSEADPAWFSASRQIRNRLLGIPSSVADRLAGKTAVEIKALLEVEIREICRTLRNELPTIDGQAVT